VMDEPKDIFINPWEGFGKETVKAAALFNDADDFFNCAYPVYPFKFKGVFDTDSR